MEKLTYQEKLTIISALRVAADTFDHDAINVKGSAKLVDQFYKQASDCRKLADKIEHNIE